MTDVLDLVLGEHSAMAKEVDALFRSCLFEEKELVNGEPPADLPPVYVTGIVLNVGFHPKRLEEARENVKNLIAQIVRDEFFKSKGAGWSFMCLCEDRQGSQWANQHRTAEQLLLMAIGLEEAGYCAPKEMWVMFPGSVPYVWFKG